MIVRRLAVLALGLAFATPAAAGSQDTPEQIAAARAQADRLIANSGAPADFANATGTRFPTVRHRPSGLKCAFWDKDVARLETVAATAEHGPGVRCSTQQGGYPLVQEVTALLAPAPVEVLADQALARERAAHPDLKILETGPKGHAPAPLKTVTFTWGGEPPANYTYLATSVVGGWEATVRIDDSTVRPGFKADTAEFTAVLSILLTQDSMMKR